VCAFPLTVVGVSDAVLQHGVPLGLLLLRHDTEVVVARVRVPQDQGELGGALHEGTAAHPRLHACGRTAQQRSALKGFTQRIQHVHYDT